MTKGIVYNDSQLYGKFFISFLMLLLLVVNLSINTSYAEEERKHGDYKSETCGDAQVKYNQVDTKNAEKFWKYFKGKGLSEKQIAGMMGSIALESHFKSDITEAGGTGPGYGLAQWTYETRKAGFKNYAKNTGRDIKDVDYQLDYIWVELNGGDKERAKGGLPLPGVLDDLKKQKTIDGAVESFLWKYENPNKAYAHEKCRALFAYEAFDKLTGTEGDSSDSDSEDSGSSSDSKGEGETGNLDFDPFIKGKPVQNNTGIDKKNGQLGSGEAYIVSSFFVTIINIALIITLILIAFYIVSVSLIILGIAMDSIVLLENKLLIKVAGQEFIDTLRGEGIKGSMKILFTRFFVPILILLLVVVGMLGEVQAFIFGKFIEIINILF